MSISDRLGFNPLYIIIPVAVVGLIVGLFVAFYEPPLTEGKVISKYNTNDTTEYVQYKDEIYRTEYRYVPRNESVRDSNGKITGSKIVLKKESYRVFDHNEYYIVKYFNGKDFIIEIAAPSKKFKNKIRKEVLYLPEIHYNDILVGKNYSVVKGLDQYSDQNNYSEKVDRRDHFSFDMRDWAMKRGIDPSQTRNRY